MGQARNQPGISSRLRRQIHALLAEQCVHPPVERLFGPAGRQYLAGLALPAVTRGRIDPALRLIDAAAAEVATADREIRAAFAGEARIARLVGPPFIDDSSLSRYRETPASSRKSSLR